MKSSPLIVASLLAASSLALQAQTTVPAASSLSSPTPNTPQSIAAEKNYGKIPLSFEANQGQTNSQVKFLSHGHGYSLFLTDSSAVIALTSYDAPPTKPDPRAKAAPPKPGKTDIVRMELAGASPNAHMEGTDLLPGIANYFFGSDPAKWHRNVPTFAKVRYSSVYPGIDLVYYGNQRQLEYDFIVAAGADPTPAKLHFDGAQKLSLSPTGDLTVATPNHQLVLHKPDIYQAKDGHREPVNGQFILLANNTVGFNVGAYDHTRELVIDPTFTMSYATYLGGTEPPFSSIQDWASAITVDQLGNVYVTGFAESTDFPVTSGAFETANTSGECVFVSKLNSDGSALLYSTFIVATKGGSYGSAIAVDSQGYAYVTGSTRSGFPVTKGAFQRIDPGGVNVALAGFVTKLNPQGSELVYSTYLAGSGQGRGGLASSPRGIAVDGSGHAFVTGQAGSGDFPVTPGAYQTTAPDSGGAFLTEMAANGKSLVYSTFLTGFVDSSQATNIALDALGQAYVIGLAGSADFPTTSGAYQTVFPYSSPFGHEVPFVAKFSADGSSLLYSTLLSGKDSGYSMPYSIAVDRTGNAYVSGATTQTDFPVTAGAYLTTLPTPGPWGSEFLTKLNSTGTDLGYSTYVFVTMLANNTNNAVAVDSIGQAYVGNPWLLVFNAAGSGLIFQTDSKTSNNGFTPTGVALDNSANVYLTGNESAYRSLAPTTKGAFQTQFPGGDYDPYIVKFAPASACGSTYTINFCGGFSGSSSLLELNGSTTLSGADLQLTDGAGYEYSSAYFHKQVNIQSFTTDFTFATQSSGKPADGITFVIQKCCTGKVGQSGGGLGYAGISDSVSLKFDLADNAGEGDNSTGLYLNGAYPSIPATTITGVSLAAGRQLHAHVTYDGVNLTLTLTNLATSATWSHSWPVNIPTAIGASTAYVGFTAGTGENTATQAITSWTYLAGPPAS